MKVHGRVSMGTHTHIYIYIYITHTHIADSMQGMRYRGKGKGPLGPALEEAATHALAGVNPSSFRSRMGMVPP